MMSFQARGPHVSRLDQSSDVSKFLIVEDNEHSAPHRMLFSIRVVLAIGRAFAPVLAKHTKQAARNLIICINLRSLAFSFC
jgi:hypothetical protein